MKQSKKSDNSLIYVLVFAALFALYHCYKSFYLNPEKFDRDFDQYQLVEGAIYSLGDDDGIGRRVLPKYTYRNGNGDRVYKKLYFKIPCHDKSLQKSSIDELFSHRFPVAISKTDPNNSFPLIRRKDYIKLGIEFPDSLREISSKYFDCE